MNLRSSVAVGGMLNNLSHAAPLAATAMPAWRECIRGN
jgi:hypothetical protein